MFFFFNDTATTEIYTLSLHDALPIYCQAGSASFPASLSGEVLSHSIGLRGTGGPFFTTSSTMVERTSLTPGRDRKSTRLNSSHANISYAVFCLKKNNIKRFHYDAINI